VVAKFCSLLVGIAVFFLQALCFVKRSQTIGLSFAELSVRLVLSLSKYDGSVLADRNEKYLTSKNKLKPGILNF